MTIAEWLEENCQGMTDDQLHEQYDDCLDEGGMIEICGLKYAPSYILKNIDETAYRCGFNDWCDGEEMDEVADSDKLWKRDDIRDAEEAIKEAA